MKRYEMRMEIGGDETLLYLCNYNNYVDPTVLNHIMNHADSYHDVARSTERNVVIELHDYLNHERIVIVFKACDTTLDYHFKSDHHEIHYTFNPEYVNGLDIIKKY